ncbi:hypothetical protein DICPUDRAFT_42846 [Dictyostelium purpureum]|uniref:Glycosyl transferase family 1 domain-containing protein n=1 Tax=Dictyostelium purpureum TaxID=5786 RepID=F1A2V5_DICPU|nr:uncharacterized protein DICPUDRAFT_42846 [Dictyostelium purpureum]EGC29470.1 hypothetical protein DICPUDRAFT_42846 [Dictyostelium purpureum]|eukprot:XP_003293999.1 hypothetical protein DICPUDRAFT_42846 [Dictyostelium purpureum]
MISKLFTKKNIFIIFIICFFIFIYNNSSIEHKLKEKYIKDQLKYNQQPNNHNNHNNNKNNKASNRSILKFKNSNFLNDIYPQLYTYKPSNINNNNNHEEFNNEVKEEWSVLPSEMMDKKRICIVTTEIEGPVLGGGIGTAYTALSQKLNEDGHVVTIVLVNKVKKLSADHWRELYKAKGINLVILDFIQDMDSIVKDKDINQENYKGVIGCTGPCIRSYRTYLWLAEHDADFDIVHFHDNGGIAYFTSLSQHQGIYFQSTNIVIGGHGPHLWERTANSANLDDGKHFEVDYLERKSVEYSNWLISPSNYMLNWMKYNRWELPVNSYVHQNLLPGENQQSQQQKEGEFLFKDQGANDNEKTAIIERNDFSEILFFGRLESRKGLDIFLIALDSLAEMLKEKNMKVTFLGSNTKLLDVNVMADYYIDSKCKKLGINCLILIGKSHTEAINYLNSQKENKLVVIASPIDNSPNTVLECLTHKLAIIAANVGGIPELIHPDDRRFVLFDPKPLAIVKKIKQLKEIGVSPARFAIDEWTRQTIWSNWHSVVNKIDADDIKIKESKYRLNTFDEKKSLAIIIPLNFKSNLDNILRNLNSISNQNSYYYNVQVIIIKANSQDYDSIEYDEVLNQVYKLLKKLKLNNHKVIEINNKLLQPYQIWNSKEILDIDAQFYLFLDFYDYLSDDALDTLGKVQVFTDASIITSSILFNNNTVSVLSNNFEQQQLKTPGGLITAASNQLNYRSSKVHSIFLGCSGMPGIMYNCYGSNNFMIERDALEDISIQYSINDQITNIFDIENSGSWDFYSLATNNGYKLETIPKNLFISNKLDYDLPSTYNQELRVLKNFDNILPNTFELSVLATRHFLISKRAYVNEIITSNTKVKELTDKCNRAVEREEFKENGEENRDYVESRGHIKVVFIRGHEKSGTSWLKKVVDLHPRIHMAKQEFHFSIIEDALEKFTTKPWQAAQEPYKSYTKKWYRSYVRNVLLSGVSTSLAPLIDWVGEKTPSPLQPVISGSKYILIIRDGRDVLVSLFWHYVRLGGFENWCGNHKHLVDPQYVKQYRTDTDYFHKNPENLLEKEICFRKIASGWAKRVRDDQSVIQALEAEPVAQVYTLRYEELHRNPEGYRKEIYEFLDLDYNEAEPLSVDDKTIPGGFNEKSDKNKFFRKGEIGDWKNYFTENNKKWFKEETGNLLIELGYELSNDW